MTKRQTKARTTKIKMKTKTKTKAQTAKPRKLTDLAVGNFKPDAIRYEITDIGQPGLRLRVFPSGAKSWCYLYRSPLDRKWTRLTLGQYPALGVKAARRQASKAAAQGRREKSCSRAWSRVTARITWLRCRVMWMTLSFSSCSCPACAIVGRASLPGVYMTFPSRWVGFRAP
jgi:hypothetical protein